MDVSVITQLIGSLGFPIVACAALFYENHKQSERHAEETEKMTDAINNNTLVLQRLVEKMGGGEDVAA